ncbi:MAG: pyrimidine 5'-nucleotidase [Fibrobacterota bacterium]
MLQKKLFLFDYDLTFYSMEAGIIQEIDRRISRYIERKTGMPFKDADELRQDFFREYGTTLRGLTKHYGVKPSDFLEYVLDVPEEVIPGPDPEISALLETIPQPKYIFTNAWGEYVRKSLDKMELSGYFLGIFDIIKFNYRCKPEEIVYIETCREIGIPPSETVLVEDSPENIKTARTLGMTTVSVGERARGCADFHVSYLKDLGNFLE